MTTQLTGLRMTYREVPLTTRQRLRIRWWRICDAFTSEIPKHDLEQITLRPGDPGYDEAPYEVTLQMMDEPLTFVANN